MMRKLFVLFSGLMLCCAMALAQDGGKSEMHQKAQADEEKGNVAAARFQYIRAFEDYVAKGQMGPGVECATKATALYYRENYYKEAFDLLRRADQNIEAATQSGSSKAAQHYLTTRERFQMYMKLRRPDSAREQLGAMESHANASSDEKVKDDLLYNKAVYYYTFGQNAQGNAVFQEMASKLTGQKAYDKVDDVYQTLIANSRKSGSANFVAQSYSSYMAWKDSVNALKMADTISVLHEQISGLQASIDDKDSSLTARQAVIWGLGILAAALAAALVVGAIVLMRYIVLTRRQRNTIRMANDNNALKAKFISNISAQLQPTLNKLDSRQPEVRALLDFTGHIQTLSALENGDDAPLTLDDTPIQPFCEGLMEQIRNRVKPGVTLTVNAQKISCRLHREYVSHILSHLLANAAEYTPEGGTVWLDFKKRGAHTIQFLVTDTGPGIAEDRREDVFKPFLEVRDLTQGDGLGLPICRQMAVKMGGELSIDPKFTRGTRFVLELHT